MRLALSIAALLVVAWVSGCFPPSPEGIEVDLPRGVSYDQELAAGDTLTMRAAVFGLRRSVLREYPQRVKLRRGIRGFRWTSESPRVAPVSGGGTLTALRPGMVDVVVRARGVTGRTRLWIQWPLDSVAFRFAAPDVVVGDTVELRFRRYFATGEEAPGRRELGLTERRMLSVRETGASYGQVARSLYMGPAGNSAPFPGDTVLFVAQRPGTVTVHGHVHGREVRAELRVRRGDGRTPRLIRFAPPGPGQPRWADRRSTGCFALDLGAWTDPRDPSRMMAYEIPRRVLPPDAPEYAHVPRAFELDETPVMRSAPEAGRRIGPVGSERIEIERYWQPLGGDSLRLVFVTPRDRLPRADVTIDASLRGELLAGIARGDGRAAPVTGRRIPCE